MTNVPQKTQVIIIGAGPSGLSLAAQLMRYGIDFVILEKNEKTTALSKAVAVQARTLEIFEQMGLAERALKEGQVTTALNLFYQGKQKAFVNLAGLGNGLSRFPYALSLEQSKTEKLLVDHLNENGKTIFWKSEFIKLEQNTNSVVVYYKDGSGQEQTLEGAYLVGCDGASSLVRHQLGLSFAGDTVPKLFYVADVTLSSAVINKNELFIFLIKKGFVLFFPMEGSGHYRIVGILPDAEEGEHYEFATVEKSITDQIAVPLEFKELRWFSTYKVHSRKANVFDNQRCFIAGDAAHIHTPAGGQGMNTGIQDAYNLAWKLASVVKGQADPALLKTYSTERVKNAQHLLKTTDRMFDIMAGTSGFMNFVRLHILPFLAGILSRSPLAKKRAFPLISQIGISYPTSTLTVSSSIGNVKAGMRMPYFVFPDGKDVYQFLNAPCFKILFFGSSQASIRLDDLKIRPELLTFKEIPAALFGSGSDFCILLRPDNHISYIGKDHEECRRFLNDLSR